MKKFLDCISIVGATPSKFHGTKKYISTGAVATTEIDESEVVEVTYEDRPSRANLSAEAGDILFAKMQGTRKTLLLDSETEKNIYSTGFYAVRANPEVITTECLYYLIDSELFLAQKDKNCSGATQKAITNGGMAKIEISVPPLSEQGILVDKLKHLTQLIADKKKQLNLFDEIIKSRFIEMFGNEIYPVTPLINLIKEGAGLSYGIVQPGNDGTGDMGILRPVDMVEGKISAASIKYISRDIGDSFKKTELTGDELLITVRGTTGITALTDGRFVGMNVTRGIAVIRYDRRKINPIYLKTYLNTDKSQRYIQEHTRGATLQQINLSDLRIQEIPVPPMTRQEKMAAFVEQVDKSKFYIIQMQILLRLLIRAIQQKTTEVLL